MSSVEVYERIDVLDYLRGFALLGIILVNIVHMLSLSPPAAHTLDAAYGGFLYGFVEGRFYTIFTFLFGIGFYIFLTRANQKGKNGTAFFLRRMLALFVLGLIHVQFQRGEALTIYAICGLIILPFYKANKVVNLVFGAAILIVLSMFSIKVLMTVPLMLLGIAAGQYRLYEGISNKRRGLIILTVTMFIAAAIALICQFHFFTLGKGMVADQTFMRIGIAIGPIVSAFYIGMFMLLLQVSFFQRLLSPLKSYGRMALTNYVSQTIFILTAGHVWHLFGKITYFQSFFVCLGICAMQLILSVAWLRFFRFGPLEWIWRSITYLELPPFRR
ncbi:DUF418 domain-containing protein [Bacillus sp. BRMEA1]|uniref:DUF418 domain-containing protein n=1 Tax=Neobacillus endophyticus TaxID=2738405 RepID=UPI0015668079|nr:DUF418 domain-containing protein [Neobacillus endophyticus]NRD77772.1 DUF418 domain-containing protein [Neobacillus endophyticus]